MLPAAALRILGLSAPFAAAAAVYYLFRFLDRKASGAAKKTFAAWIKGERYAEIDLAAVVIRSFDTLYGAPPTRPCCIGAPAASICFANSGDKPESLPTLNSRAASGERDLISGRPHGVVHTPTAGRSAWPRMCT